MVEAEGIGRTECNSGGVDDPLREWRADSARLDARDRTPAPNARALKRRTVELAREMAAWRGVVRSSPACTCRPSTSPSSVNWVAVNVLAEFSSRHVTAATAGVGKPIEDRLTIGLRR